MTLPAERLVEFQSLAKENKWPPPDIFEKAAKTGGTKTKAAEDTVRPAEESASAKPGARKRRSAKAGA
jgi:hypothetical protein